MLGRNGRPGFTNTSCMENLVADRKFVGCSKLRSRVDKSSMGLEDKNNRLPYLGQNFSFKSSTPTQEPRSGIRRDPTWLTFSPRTSSGISPPSPATTLVEGCAWPE